jgi:hypothetical protein
MRPRDRKDTRQVRKAFRMAERTAVDADDEVEVVVLPDSRKGLASTADNRISSDRRKDGITSHKPRDTRSNRDGVNGVRRRTTVAHSIMVIPTQVGREERILNHGRIRIAANGPVPKP